MPAPRSLVVGKIPIVAGGLAPVGAAPSPLGGAGATGPGLGQIPFFMQVQLHDNWCWAATAVSVSVFFNSASKWTQCLIANNTLSLASGVDCCNDGSHPDCDRPWYLDRALSSTSNLNDVRSGSVGFAEIVTVIGDWKPLGVRVGWIGGGGHFIIIRGWTKTSAGDEFVHVSDPFYGSSTVLYVDFVGRYRSLGTWTHTYWTQP